MAVVCSGAPTVLQQLGEKRDFETELSRPGLRREEFVLHVHTRIPIRSGARRDPGYEVKVTHTPTQTVKTYAGGASGNWVACFAEELVGELYGEPNR